jgi:microcystin degradation protein MlrC
MCFQVITNGNPELAREIADDMGATAWRLRDALLNTTKIYKADESVTLAKQAIVDGKTPVVIADYSDRSGAATWILDQIIKQNLSNSLVVTIADKKAVDALRKKGVRPGDPFDMMVGGRLDEADGKPVHVVGTINTVSNGAGRGGSRGELWISVKFGNNDVLVLSPHLVQIMEPSSIQELGINPDDFKVIVLKSRVHFRRGFDDNGYAKTILIAEPPGGGLGTVHLDQLPYEHLILKNYYPYGNPQYP